MQTVQYNIQQFHNTFREYGSGSKPVALTVHVKKSPDKFSTSKFAIEWQSYNTTKSQMNAAKLADINLISSGNNVMRCNIQNKIWDFAMEWSITTKRLNSR